MTDAHPLVAEQLFQTFEDGGRAHTVLGGVSLRLCRGELSVLMGPSGSGKSTLLAVLAGLLQPTAGRVWLMGEPMWPGEQSAREQLRRRHSGFIFQGYNLFPALTARQQLEIALRWVEGTPPHKARRRAEETLRLLGLGERMHLRPAQLSGGEKQRVAIGRALVKEPALCFADEPTSALDWGHGEEVMWLLKAAARERGASILVVTHDTRVLTFADRVFHLREGSLNESRVDGEGLASESWRSSTPESQGV